MRVPRRMRRAWIKRDEHGTRSCIVDDLVEPAFQKKH